MSPQPYIDVDPDRDEPPIDAEGHTIQAYGQDGTCSLCGAEAETFAGPVELADGKYVTGWRCRETLECRKRRQLPPSPEGDTA